MMLLTPFLCAAVTLIAAAAEGHDIPAALETGELSLPPLVGSELMVDKNVEGASGRAKRGANCPSHWTLGWGERCFRYISVPQDWALAEKNCIHHGGHLVSLHNNQEYRYVQDLIRSETNDFQITWIGAHAAGSSRNWIWTDGSTFNWSFFGHGQPDNCCEGQNCLAMNWGDSKRMDDDTCHVWRPSVCVRNSW